MQSTPELELTSMKQNSQERRTTLDSTEMDLNAQRQKTLEQQHTQSLKSNKPDRVQQLNQFKTQLIQISQKLDFLHQLQNLNFIATMKLILDQMKLVYRAAYPSAPLQASAYRSYATNHQLPGFSARHPEIYPQGKEVEMTAMTRSNEPALSAESNTLGTAPIVSQSPG